jgi:hypothetical protein
VFCGSVGRVSWGREERKGGRAGCKSNQARDDTYIIYQGGPRVFDNQIFCMYAKTIFGEVVDPAWQAAAGLEDARSCCEWQLESGLCSWIFDSDEITLHPITRRAP